MKKTHVYANGQILTRNDVPDNNKRYFYLHDRIGSIRQIIKMSGDVANYYIYNPFGKGDF